MNPHAPAPEVVLADPLSATADDLGVALGPEDVRRLAQHLVELLALADWHLVRGDP